jgi:hypothetical protein
MFALPICTWILNAEGQKKGRSDLTWGALGAIGDFERVVFSGTSSPNCLTFPS